jgi:Flagellar transcriptional activator (FlhC)
MLASCVRTTALKRWRISLQRQLQNSSKPLGTHANFVINFCQIRFEPKSPELHKEETMRVSDDRYTRDRQKFDLALRLIHHEARTFTIRQWTGLSDDRIRKLYRSYVLEHESGVVLRHRGKSPRQAAFFFRNPETNFQAAQLASLFLMYGLVRGTGLKVEPHYRLGSLESGALLCRAYEAYLDLHSPASISFEHAWFLLLALARHDEVGVVRCSNCGGLRLRDLLARHKHTCDNCNHGPVPPLMH